MFKTIEICSCFNYISGKIIGCNFSVEFTRYIKLSSHYFLRAFMKNKPQTNTLLTPHSAFTNYISIFCIIPNLSWSIWRKFFDTKGLLSAGFTVKRKSAHFLIIYKATLVAQLLRVWELLFPEPLAQTIGIFLVDLLGEKSTYRKTKYKNKYNNPSHRYKRFVLYIIL